MMGLKEEKTQEKNEKLKKEMEALRKIRKASKELAFRFRNSYEEPPLKAQHRVNERAGQIIQVNQVHLQNKDREYSLLIAGKDDEEILEMIKKLALGEIKANYTVFRGTYREAVNLLRKRVKNLSALSLAFLLSVPDIPHDGDLCCFSDYINGLSYFLKQVSEAFDLVDEIYAHLVN